MSGAKIRGCEESIFPKRGKKGRRRKVLFLLAVSRRGGFSAGEKGRDEKEGPADVSRRGLKRHEPRLVEAPIHCAFQR